MTSHYCNVHIAAECDTDDIHEVKTRAFGFNTAATLVADVFDNKNIYSVLLLSEKAVTKICKVTPLNTRPYKRN